MDLVDVHGLLLSVVDPRRTSTAGVIGDGVDERRTPPTVGCRTRETERGERGRSSPRVDTVRGGTATRGAAVLRLHRRPAHGEENPACPGCVASALGEAARREAAGSTQRGRPAHGEAAALQHPSQASTCRRCGLAVRDSHAAGMRKPVEATDALRPTGGGRSAESGPSQLSGGGSDQLPTARRVQRVKRSTSTARPVSSE